MSEVLERAMAVREYAAGIRRYLHRNPEIAFQEHNTTALVKRELSGMGVEILDLPLETGAVGVIHGNKPGKGAVTALRADLDALPMTDQSGADHASANPLAAHTCGHDGHTAILLGTAKVLRGMTDRFAGTARLLFQPAEESLGGALKIIEAGALANPPADTAVALHSWPYLPAGSVGVWEGQYMASADSFQVRITGRSGHGARPHAAVNPIPAAALAISALQNIVAGEIIASQQAVVTVCVMSGGTAFNIIPDEVTFGGTVRCLDEGVRRELKARIERTVTGAARTLGCEAALAYHFGVPSLVNDPQVAKAVKKAAAEALGGEHVLSLDGPVMGSEDFAEIINTAGGRGALFRLGMGVEGREVTALHNSRFDFNDDAIPAGVAAFTQYVLNANG